MLKKIYKLANNNDFEGFVNEILHQILKEYVTTYSRKVTDDIIDFIATENLTFKHLIMSNLRQRNVVEARYMCIYYYVYEKGFTKTEAAKIFNRHHASAVHATQTIEDIPDLKARYNAIIKKWKELNKV